MKFTLSEINQKIVDLINQYELEPSELFYIFLVYNSPIETLIRYCSYVKHESQLVVEMVNGEKVAKPKKSRLAKANIERLIEKKIIKYVGFDKEFNLHDLVLEDKFRKILDDKFKMTTRESSYGEEYYDNYPLSFTSERGELYPLRNADRDIVIELYESNVSEEEHRDVMRVLKEKKHLIKMKIDNFITSGFYKNLIQSNNQAPSQNFTIA